MIDYLKNLDIKKIKERAKPIAITAVCFVAVFTAGFGVGKNKTNSSANTTKRSTNYTTNSNTAEKPTVPTASQSDCKIKGSKSKIYHVPGGSFYNRTNAAQCFETEEEAQAAGYTKSSR
jgi:hypothetical protein